MAKKIEIIGVKPKRIDIVDQPKRRVERNEVAAALGANPAGRQPAGDLDLIGLAELGTQLVARLRSSGGRPALSDATEICRVPLSPNDVRSLEKITDQIGQTTGTKPSPGQVASMIVREYCRLRSADDIAGHDPAEHDSNVGRHSIAELKPRIADIVRESSELEQKANALANAVKAIKADLDGQMGKI
jgi:hypothetical protein